MKKILTLLIFSTTFAVFPQGEAANWFFGNGAGLNFDVATGNVTPSTDAMTTISTNEGCSSISDSNGNLLFYTDGRTVWDANHQIMPNANYNSGTGLLGDPSSTSSGVIVPHPGNPNLFYIFTVDEPHHNNAWAFPNQGPTDINGNPLSFYQETYGGTPSIPQDDDGYNNGFNYSLVDITLNGGFGDVIDSEKNVHLITYDENDPEQSLYKCAEKITAVQGNDCQSFWVITQFVDTFYAFIIDENGVNTTPVTSVVDPFITTAGYRRNGIGYIKSSPDGTKIAACHSQNINLPSDVNTSPTTGSLWLYDFDDETGIISNPVNLIDNIQTYGTEFSADSKKLYASNGTQVRQFDLENNNNPTIVYQGTSFISSLQLAPNNKIYVCNNESNTTLDVIENPEGVGINCNYNASGQTLSNGTFASLGLPPFITSFLIQDYINIISPLSEEIITELPLCGEQNYTLIAEDIPGATYTWTFNGEVLSENNFDLVTTEEGTYNVLIDNIPNECNKTIIGEAIVSFFEVPIIANQPEDILICDDNNDNNWSFDFSNIIDPQIIGNQDSTLFSTHYFESQDDADNNENEITFPYQNISNPQEIFVRIDNNEFSNCYDTTSFFIEIFNTPIINPIDDIEICDDDSDGNTMNGQTVYDLESLNSIILGNQDSSLYNISYHNLQEDADDGDNELSLLYYNNNPNQEEIFIRIENNLNTDCFETSSFNLIVHPLPEAFNVNLFQCDEDGLSDGFTLFNLTEANDALTGGAPNTSVKFFTSLIDAENNNDDIDGTSFNNWENPQTIFAQVIDDTTGCYSIAELSLEVSATSAHDATLSHCDDDGTEDGFYNFTLSDANADVLAGLPDNLELTYYETYENALLETNPLNNAFTNTIPYSQTIYVRAENDNNCYGVNEIQLTVFELPNIEIDEDILYCLNFFPELVTLTGGVLNDSPSNYYYSWSTGQNTSQIQVNET